MFRSAFHMKSVDCIHHMVCLWHVHQCMACLLDLAVKWASDFMLDCTNVLWHGASSVVPKGWRKPPHYTVHIWWAGLSVSDAYTPQAHRFPQKVIHGHGQHTFSFTSLLVSQHRLSWLTIHQSGLAYSVLAVIRDGYCGCQSFCVYPRWGGVQLNSLTLDFITQGTDKRRKAKCFFGVFFFVFSTLLSVSQPTFCLSPCKAVQRN